MTGHELLSAMSTSPLVDAVFQTCPNVYCVRYLHQVEICSLEMSVHDWIFVREHKVAVVAQVSQMALVRHGARVGVYIWCRNCHAASMLLEVRGSGRDDARAKRRSKGQSTVRACL